MVIGSPSVDVCVCVCVCVSCTCPSTCVSLCPSVCPSCLSCMPSARTVPPSTTASPRCHWSVFVTPPPPHPTPSHQRVLLPVIGRSQDHSGALMAEEFKACLISLGYDVENNKQVGLSTTTQRGSARCLGSPPPGASHSFIPDAPVGLPASNPRRVGRSSGVSLSFSFSSFPDTLPLIVLVTGRPGSLVW